MLLSQRLGLKPAAKLSQGRDLDGETRNLLWNALDALVWAYWVAGDRFDPKAQAVGTMVRGIWAMRFKAAMDQMPPFKSSRVDTSGHDVLRRIVMKSSWIEVLDLIEFIVKHLPKALNEPLIKAVNRMLELESSPFRLVGEEFSEITNETEIAAVETALAEPGLASNHLRNALEKLVDRKNPDYRNSMKESISAVEAVCQKVTGKLGSTMADCLRALKGHHAFHPALEGALTKLYAFTSDAGGIRHAMTDDNEHPTRADAQFMLVSCSALTSYIRALLAERPA